MSATTSDRYCDKKTRSDELLPTVMAKLLPIYGPSKQSTKEEDCEEGTDLKVITFDGDISIAVRIREHSYRANFGREFTIRTSSGNGRTELQKIIEQGYCRYMFYGFEKSKDSIEIPFWVLIDLDIVRKYWKRLKKRPKTNVDNSTFVATSWYELHMIDADVIMATSGQVLRKTL